MFHKKCKQIEEIDTRTIKRLLKQIEDLEQRTTKLWVKDENGLLGCPFCGGKATIEVSESHMIYMFVVKCGTPLFKCSAMRCEVWGCMDKELAIEKWNTRA